MGRSPSKLRGRPTTTVHLYDDQGRLARSVESSEFTDEDRALLIAYRRWQNEQCPGCGHPKATAWHPDNGGFFEVERHITCHACTAMKQAGANETGDKKEEVEPVTYLAIHDTRDYDARPLPEAADL